MLEFTPPFVTPLTHAETRVEQHHKGLALMRRSFSPDVLNIEEETCQSFKHPVCQFLNTLKALKNQPSGLERLLTKDDNFGHRRMTKFVIVQCTGAFLW